MPYRASPRAIALSVRVPNIRMYYSERFLEPISNLTAKYKAKYGLPTEMTKILLQIASFSSAYPDMLPQNSQFSQRILVISVRH